MVTDEDLDDHLMMEVSWQGNRAVSLDGYRMAVNSLICYGMNLMVCKKAFKKNITG